jgi:hypothetical protein
VTWRLFYQARGYGCMERSGSLKPVPLGATRESLGYCAQCRADHCLFPGNGRPAYRREFPRGEDHGRYWCAVEARAQGLAPNGRPLTPSCWNCQELRRNGHGYLCRYRLDDPPYGKATMMLNRRVADTGCTVYKLRRVMDIPPLE